MKNIYFKSNIATPKFLILLFTVLLGFSFAASAQVRVPFTQRTSQYTPTKKIYNIKGDFSMLGNTNLTLQNYGVTTENGYNNMVYVDVDAAGLTGLGGTPTFNSSTATLTLSTENGAVPSCSNIIYAGLYWTGRAGNSSPNNTTFNVTKNGVTKNFSKRKIQFKGPGATAYTEFTASPQDIYYPTNQDELMYSAYTEVTDYVKTHGVGAYTAADIALIEGNGGGTGYYGGWGMVIIYENSKMRYRDVTLFDGHAFVISGNASNNLPISGFNTVQSGPVGIKLGMIAGEGDNGITGDYFQIQRQDNNTWQSLSHSANSPTNFFNSSIQTPGARTPNLVNNSGLDISMFTLPNTNNGIITNNQTSTTFRYGSTQDTYCIFAIAMSVDAYIPEVEGDLAAISINGSPVPGVGPYTALPGQEMEFKIKVRNRGTEAINNSKIVIPIPYNTVYVPNSAVRNVYFTPSPTPNALTYNPALGSNGSVVWDIGTLPVPATGPDTILGDLTFKVTATTDCELLKNANCNNVVAVNGVLSGVGAITGIVVSEKDLIQGFTSNGTCQGDPIAAPLLVNINATEYVNANCQSTPPITAFTFCSTGASIPITQVSGSFPNGSTFYNQYPVTPSAIQYTINNPFPATLGTITYYAVPPGALQGCYFQFTITVTSINSTPTVPANLTYCQGATAAPIVATPSNPNYTVYYYTSPTGAPQVSITPSTATVGTTTYYAAEAAGPNCIGPKVPILVSVYASPIVTAPAALNLNGCGTSAITGLPYSSTPVAITLAQFTAAGGSISNASQIGNYTITYFDSTSGTCPAVVTRTFQVVNICGTITVTQPINVLDNVPPVLAGLPTTPTTISCPATPNWVTPTASDNCGATVTLTSADATTPGACAGSYTIVRTWTATDACGNTATGTQTFIVTDIIAPVIAALPAPSTISCPATPSFAQATATDSCGSAVTLNFVDVQTAGSCPSNYTIVRTWTASDACGNASTATQSITVQDVTAPVISTQAQNITVQCGAGNQASLNAWLASNGGAVAADACSAVTWTNNFTAAPTGCSGAVTVIFTATDACGNASTTSASFTLQDNVAPVAPAAPADVALTCSADVPANISLTAQDNCAGAITVQGVDVTTPGTCAGSFTIVRTWTFTDACGNSSSVSQNIVIKDIVAPVIPAAPADVTVQCASQVPANVTLTATDTCQGPITAQGVDVTTPGSCPNSFVIVRTWTFTDACGNAASVSQTITVNDTIAPVAPAAPAAVAVACASLVPANVTLTAQDNCEGAITAQGVDVTTPGSCANSFTIVRTWTFADACGNTSSVSQTITVSDTVAPVAPAAPANVTAQCSADVPANVTLTATDNCQGAITAQGVDVTTPGSCPNSFTIVRTWTFADACGNTSSVSQTISVNDNVAPVAPAAPANVTAQCSADVPANVTLTAQDNCSGAITAQGVDVTTPGTCAGSFTIVRTWTFADACGNTSSVSQTISVNDTTAPVAPAAPAAVTLACAGDVPANITLTAQDNCQGAITAQGVDVTTAGSCANSFTIVRTWTFADACGNTSSVSQTITVNDTVAPTISALPAASTIDCPATPSFATPTATDNCPGTVTLTFADAQTPGACAGAYSITRTWTATDVCGNTATATQTITVQDITAPVISTQAQDLAIQCGAGNANALNDWLASNGGAAATDTCSAVTWTNNYAGIGNDCTAAVTVIFTATDACGNASTTSATFTVSDSTAPVAPAAPAAVTVQCAADVPANVTLTAVDNCAGNIAVQGVDVTTPGTCAGSYVIVRTWTFTDACANSVSVTQTITVNDTTAPVAPTAPAAVTVACASDVPANVTLTATDNCQGAITAQGVDVTTPGSCPNSFTIVRTWTFTDSCGNASSVSQTITVNDTIAPVAPAAPANVTAQCSSEVPANVTLTAQDNCSGAITAQGVDVTTPGACAGTFTIVRTWTFTDACNNSSSVSQTISVNDTTAPTAPTAPADVTLACAGDVPANVTLSATDNCGEVITAQGVDVTTPGSCANSFVVVRTWTFADACGNTSSVSQTITVNDTVAPVIDALPATSTIDCPATPAFAQATATDNCAGAVTLTFVDAQTPGTCAGSYSIVRTWTATDVCGNTSTATQTINVQDVTAPVISTQAQDLAIQCGTGNANALNDWLASNGGASATDTCSDVTWTNNYAGIGNDCTAAVTVIFTATDACGNASTTSATFTVSDSTAPVAPEAPAAVTVQCSTDVPANVTLTAVDNCAGNIAVQGVDVTTPGACAGSYVIVRTWTFTDACANSVSVSQTITVNDTTAPVAPQAPAAVTYACAGDVPASETLTAQDNCQGAIAAQGVDVTTPGSCPNSFVIVRTWTFADSCGNTSSVSQTITVNDTIAPTAPAAPENVTAQCSSEVPANVTLSATDNCGDVITAQGVDVTTPGACAGTFTIVRTWTFTDACGNASSVSQTISVNDTTAPTAPTAPADVTVACAADVPANVTLSATDNCGEVITAQGVDVTTAGTCANNFTVVRTWTFTDACGNASSVSQTISVNDNVAPVISQLPAASTIDCPATPEFATPTATDNCIGEVTLTFEDAQTAGACAGAYTIVRTWTATDVCGNTSTATQTINVQDITAPTITTQAANLAIQCGAGNENALNDWLASNGGAAATDTCSAVTWTNNYAGIGNDCTAAVTVIFTATDACGNASTTSATFTVSDSTAPVAPEAPAAVTVQCATDVPANVTLTATDNCAGTITAQGVDVTTPGACAGSYVIVRTWTFTDACANSVSISQTITVNDTTAPVAPEAPATLTLACASEVPANVTLTATDNCQGAITAQGVDVTTPGTCANSFVIVRTWTFTDACGNSSSVSQTINVNDTIAPVAPAAPADFAGQCAAEVPANVTLSATDNCGDVITAQGVDVTTAGSCPNSFTIVRTWTFTDACGNSSSVSQNIVINDTTAPVAPAAPADITAQCSAEIPANVTLTATDNCGETISAQGVDVTTPGACAGSFTTVRTWTFTDACGNTSSVSQTISVNDTTAPVAPAAPADVTVACGSEVPAAPVLTATDNCDATPITATAIEVLTPGACANTFVIVRTWTFTDACGNSSSVTQTVNVIDNIAPTFLEAVPADVTASCDAIAAPATLTAVDNCQNATVPVTMTETTTPGACAGSYTLVRTWTATDACGNVATASQTITVQDTTAPVFVETLPDLAITAECGSVPAPAVLTATDNCNAAGVAVVYAETSVPGTCPVTEIITRTWTANDGCGNIVTHTQTVTVQDTTGPVADVTLDPVVNVSCADVPPVPTLNFSDACSAVGTPVFTEVITEPINGNYSITWTWTVADACNNTSTFTQVVNVTVNDALIVVTNQQCNEDTSATIDLATLLPAGTPAGGTWVNVDNVPGLNGTVLTPFGTANGIYNVDYVIDDATCPRTVRIAVDINEIYCEVDPACIVTIHNAFSPNNDGINEVFFIENFGEPCIPSNSVEIYNRWGILVYETKQYDNTTRAFRGVSEGRVTVNKADELPTGTYFYIIHYTDSDGKNYDKDGYLYLSR
ncbi:MAG: gliding motility-associated C-terminal domain-containing protein [Flavobacterium sp.]|uniref:HYR-like domain-containing protein n=1 Tax=Flavobacterium sp. TaxID=239 RepID=UPI001205CD8B|nr:gliding motility-associated C-terminal domain-containing protein [Flavobacterium sp.]RZJ64198.1 MAG: gliding motility-associated C-terminal domain-containing protein [Flavobacterium sp.]